jgi:hypothetical protein
MSITERNSIFKSSGARTAAMAVVLAMTAFAYGRYYDLLDNIAVKQGHFEAVPGIGDLPYEFPMDHGARIIEVDVIRDLLMWSSEMSGAGLSGSTKYAVLARLAQSYMALAKWADFETTGVSAVGFLYEAGTGRVFPPSDPKSKYLFVIRGGRVTDRASAAAPDQPTLYRQPSLRSVARRVVDVQDLRGLVMSETVVERLRLVALRRLKVDDNGQQVDMCLPIMLGSDAPEVDGRNAAEYAAHVISMAKNKMPYEFEDVVRTAFGAPIPTIEDMWEATLRTMDIRPWSSNLVLCMTTAE